MCVGVCVGVGVTSSWFCCADFSKTNDHPLATVPKSQIPESRIPSDGDYLIELYSTGEKAGRVHVCDWKECRRGFATMRALIYHIGTYHISAMDRDLFYVCMWEGCSKDMVCQKRGNLITHLHTHLVKSRILPQSHPEVNQAPCGATDPTCPVPPPGFVPFTNSKSGRLQARTTQLLTDSASTPRARAYTSASSYSTPLSGAGRPGALGSPAPYGSASYGSTAPGLPAGRAPPAQTPLQSALSQAQTAMAIQQQIDLTEKSRSRQREWAGTFWELDPVCDVSTSESIRFTSALVLRNLGE